jgi:hypothetical protein
MARRGATWCSWLERQVSPLDGGLQKRGVLCGEHRIENERFSFATAVRARSATAVLLDFFRRRVQ